MLPDITNRRNAAEDGCTTRRTQRRDSNKAELGAVGKKLLRRRVVYALVWKEKEDKVVKRLKMA